MFSGTRPCARRLFAAATGFGVSVVAAAALTLVVAAGCSKDPCESEDKLYCESANSCCAKDHPYNDGHGTCYTTMASCRAGGYACEICH
jgi:hypothetical protein